MRTFKNLNRLILPTVLIISAIILTNCAWYITRDRNSDPFYRDDGESDFLRLPLVKPYDAIQGSEEHGWTIGLFYPSKESSYYLSIFHSKKISVNLRSIYVFTDSTDQSIKSRNTSNKFWFVLLIDEKEERGFETENQFLSYIKTAGLEDPMWIDLNDAYLEFHETGCTSWIPECK